MSRGDAHILVACDTEGCEEEIEIALTALAGRGEWDERNVKGVLKGAGWSTDTEDNDYCDTCTEERATRDEG